MKKIGALWFISLVILSLIISSSAQTTQPPNPTATTEKTSEIPKTLSTQIEVPYWLEVFTRVLFGVKQEKIEFSLIMILLSVAAMLFVIIYSVIDFVPFFEGKLQLPAAIIVTIIVSVTGAVRIGAQWLIDLAKIFSFLERWGSGALMFIIVVAIICIFLIRIVTSNLKEVFELKKAGIEGKNTGKLLAFMAAQKKAFGDALDNNRSV